MASSKDAACLASIVVTALNQIDVRCNIRLPNLVFGQCCMFYIDVYHNIDVIMTTMASQITSLTVVYSIVYSDADQRKHQSSASLAFVWGIHRDRWIPRTKGQLREKMFPFDDVIMVLWDQWMENLWLSKVSANERRRYESPWDVAWNDKYDLTCRIKTSPHTTRGV